MSQQNERIVNGSSNNSEHRIDQSVSNSGDHILNNTEIVNGIVQVQIVDNRNNTGDQEVDEQKEVELTQTDRLNRQLLDSLRDRLNQGTFSFPNPSTVGDNMDDVNSSAECIVIGVAGVTNGGKSTLCEKLKSTVPNCHIINFDDFFLLEHEVPIVPGVNHGNWDDLDAIDTDKFFDTFIKERDNLIQHYRKDPSMGKPVLVIDGFIIFNYRPILPYFSGKYFITLPKEECKRRRRLRSDYVPPDPPHYFEALAWPMYERNLAEIQDQQDIVYVSGEEDPGKILGVVQEKIKLLLLT